MEYQIKFKRSVEFAVSTFVEAFSKEEAIQKVAQELFKQTVEQLTDGSIKLQPDEVVEIQEKELE